jgi:hypothetical protein
LKKPSPYTGDLKNAELAEPYSDLINKWLYKKRTMGVFTQIEEIVLLS